MLTSLSLAILIVSVVFIVLCTVVVALRIQARRVKQLSVQADDYVIFAALVRASVLLRILDMDINSLRL